MLLQSRFVELGGGAKNQGGWSGKWPLSTFCYCFLSLFAGAPHVLFIGLHFCYKVATVQKLSFLCHSNGFLTRVSRLTAITISVLQVPVSVFIDSRSFFGQS